MLQDPKVIKKEIEESLRGIDIFQSRLEAGKTLHVYPDSDSDSEYGDVEIIYDAGDLDNSISAMPIEFRPGCFSDARCFSQEGLGRDSARATLERNSPVLGSESPQSPSKHTQWDSNCVAIGEHTESSPFEKKAHVYF
jgi:hypothetical protein